MRESGASLLARVRSAAGLSGSLVGTSDTQTLTNKTINSASNTITVAQSAVTNLTTDLAAKAPLASPTFTGTMRLPSAGWIQSANGSERIFFDDATGIFYLKGSGGTRIRNGSDSDMLIVGNTGIGTFAGQVRCAGLGVSNSANATSLGSVVKKMEVFDASGNSLGFVPIYNSIT